MKLGFGVVVQLIAYAAESGQMTGEGGNGCWTLRIRCMNFERTSLAAACSSQ
jgi:hypothetical protein